MQAIIRIYILKCYPRFVINFKRVSWASPFASAAGRALVNQARFAVLAMRRPSLTHPAIAGLFQASAIRQTIPHPDTGLPSDFLRKLQGRSRTAHSDLWPEMTRRAL